METTQSKRGPWEGKRAPNKAGFKEKRDEYSHKKRKGHFIKSRNDGANRKTT